MNAVTKIPRRVEVDSNFDQVVSRTIAYLDPENQNLAQPPPYWEDAESLITLIALLGGAFVSYCIIFIHLLRIT